MKAEDKQVLIEDCQRDILDLERDIARCDAIGTVDYLLYLQSRLKRQQIALAALTAQPINLSSCRTLWYDHDDLSAEVKCIPVKDIKKAIRAAGYEVIE